MELSLLKSLILPLICPNELPVQINPNLEIILSDLRPSIIRA